MPTGYTAAVADGTITELEPFALQLARGMGALITMRDDPHDAPIPDRFEATDRHSRKLAELRAECDALLALSTADAQAAADAEYAAYEGDRAKAEAEQTERRNRYNSMLAKVVAWQGAPEGIKEFALEQLHRGRDFDCGEPFRYWRDPPERDGAKWREAKIKRLHRDMEYHAAEDAKERERTESRNTWLAQLRASLAESVSA
jgi:hypothetical protein